MTNNTYSIETDFGTLTLALPAENTSWRASLAVKSITPCIQEILFTLDSETPEPPPRTCLEWSIPQKDTACRWYANCDRRTNMPPNWGSHLGSQLAFSAPVLSLYSQSGLNRMTFALSEAMREVRFGAGINEHTSNIDCYTWLFETPEAHLEHYSAKILVSTEKIFFSDAVRKAFDWYASMKEYKTADAPEAAFELLYSSWYSYHKERLSADVLEKELKLASGLGMKTVIVDDGWQTDDYSGGPYSHCGDWKPAASRFPDMKKHVENVHKLGMKYILWYSVPFVGEKSENFERFKGKYLYTRMADAHVLDPRFPEVREFLITTYENAVREWDLDGFKLDFIDSFPVPWSSDPAVAEDFAGRDCKTISEGVDRLMTDVMTRLRRLKNDILIEFRQNYTGPAIRKYGNMIRAADCPADIQMNRIRTIDLRIAASEKTAIHSDMLEWNMQDSPESAARQFIAILFSVPQISVRLEELPHEHHAMLEFWLGFWREHRDLLLRGHLTPYHPEMNYPLVRTTLNGEELLAVYDGHQTLEIAEGMTSYIVNGTEIDSLVVETQSEMTIKTFDVFGVNVLETSVGKGLSRVSIPISGTAILKV